MGKTVPDPKDQKFNPGDVAAFPFMTNIDRRNCHRTVPMKVLCFGPSRTGTASLRQALIDLGYKDCYHFTALIAENPPDQQMWIEAIEAKFQNNGKPFTRKQWDQLLGRCQAVTDTPCVFFWKELIEAYPDAKVIVTTRDSADQWQHSMVNTIIPFVKNFVEPPTSIMARFVQYFTPADSGSYRMSKLMYDNFPMFRALRYDMENGTETAKEWYQSHLKDLEDSVPQEKLLVMNIKEGWQPLCHFLGEDVPEYPFPRKNDMAVFQKNATTLGQVMQQAALWEMTKTLGGAMVGLLAFGLGVARYKRWY